MCDFLTNRILSTRESDFLLQISIQTLLQPIRFLTAFAFQIPIRQTILTDMALDTTEEVEGDRCQASVECVTRIFQRVSENRDKRVCEIFERVTGFYGEVGSALARLSPMEKQMLSHALQQSADYKAVVVDGGIKINVATIGEGGHLQCTLYFSSSDTLTFLKQAICKAYMLEDKALLVVRIRNTDGPIIQPVLHTSSGQTVTGDSEETLTSMGFSMCNLVFLEVL